MMLPPTRNKSKIAQAVDGVVDGLDGLDDVPLVITSEWQVVDRKLVELGEVLAHFASRVTALEAAARVAAPDPEEQSRATQLESLSDRIIRLHDRVQDLELALAQNEERTSLSLIMERLVKRFVRGARR